MLAQLKACKDITKSCQSFYSSIYSLLLMVNFSPSRNSYFLMCFLLSILLFSIVYRLFRKSFFVVCDTDQQTEIRQLKWNSTHCICLPCKIQIFLCICMDSNSVSLVRCLVISISENCTVCGIFRISAHCLTCLQGLCSECDRLYHSNPDRANHCRTAVSSSSKNRSSHWSVSVVRTI